MPTLLQPITYVGDVVNAMRILNAADGYIAEADFRAAGVSEATIWVMLRANLIVRAWPSESVPPHFAKVVTR
jgi:hypothetical protein